MATIRKTVEIAAAADNVWDAVRDIYAVHRRFATGFVTNTEKQDDGSRMVTFANGIVAREVIVTVDDKARRLVYSAAGGRLAHHNASFAVEPTGPATCRVHWTADLLPDVMAEAISGMMDAGCAAMKPALEKDAA